MNNFKKILSNISLTALLSATFTVSGCSDDTGIIDKDDNQERQRQTDEFIKSSNENDELKPDGTATKIRGKSGWSGL